MNERSRFETAAEIGPRAAWLTAVDALGDHETACAACWRRRVPRCDEGRRLLAAEEAAYRVLADVRSEVRP